MALQSPVFNLKPIQPQESPVDRFGKIAAIQQMLEGGQLRRQELEFRQQEHQDQQQLIQRKQAAIQRVSQIMQQAGGDIEKAMDLITQDGELMTLAPEIVGVIQTTAQRRKPAAPKTSTVKTVQDGKAGTKVINEMESIGNFYEEPPKESTTAEPTSVREYQFYADQEMKAGRTPKSFEEWSAKPTSSGTPTSEIQQYQFYADQETKAGRKPISFDEWQNRDANRKRVVPPSVVIQTINGKGEDVTRIVPKVPGSEFAAPRTAEAKNKEAGRELLNKSIDAGEALSRKIIKRIGPAQRAEAIKRGVEAVFGTDPEFRTYQDARKSIAGNLAVATQGSRPSDKDILEIWLPMVPDAYRDTSESAAMKWKMIRQSGGLPEYGAGSGTAAPAGEFTIKGREGVYVRNPDGSAKRVR